MGVGVALGPPSMSRKMVMVRAVRRSHLEAVGERERAWERAVLRRRGDLGRRSLRSVVGEASISNQDGVGDEVGELTVDEGGEGESWVR